MKWYITQLIYQICNTSTVKQYDEQIRIISAHDKEEAMEKVIELGRCQEEEFEDVNGNKVLWKLVETSIFAELPVLNDGAMLFSSTHENENPRNFLRHSLDLKILNRNRVLLD